ncbi:hypothetical protein HPB49_015485 [Dermacentor silvarum]|uniref:Uncharacterized protein n=1 Tax=Dermacentor silvarum TaxID=543639 RepID=A0ACB8D6D9_DERSI|nr:hypothetical protein HPB49_015485 [Dermacentor silvarum]
MYVDVGEPLSVETLFNGIRSAFSEPLSTVVHCAGILRTAPLSQCTDELFDDIIRVELKGTFLVTRAASRDMLRSGTPLSEWRGAIVNISSLAAKCGSMPSCAMGDKNPSQQWGPGRPHHCASDASDRFRPSVVDIDTSDGYSTEDMASDSDFTVVSSRRLKRKIRRTSPTGRQSPIKASGMRSYTISYVPKTTTDIMSSLNRQSLTEYLELVAPGQVEQIRINAQKNILSVEVNTKTILDTLKAIGQLGNIPVRAFFAYDKETTTGVIYDVDEDITDSSLEKLLSSSAPVLGFHRFGRSRCVKVVFQSETLPTHVEVGYVRHSVRPYVPRPL